LKRIVIEGIDGSGKTSLAGLLGDDLASRGHSPHIISQFKRREYDSIADAFNRTGCMSPEVLVALHSGCSVLDESEVPLTADVLIKDRSAYSTYASCMTRGVNPELIAKLVEIAPVPHVIVFLKTKPALCYDRVIERGDIKFYECGMDRLYRGRVMEGFDAFINERLPRDLIRQVFLNTMESWNKFFSEILPRDLTIEVVDFDLKDSKALIERISERIL
jgi:thymidylate kinase